MNDKELVSTERLQARTYCTVRLNDSCNVHFADAYQSFLASLMILQSSKYSQRRPAHLFTDSYTSSALQ